MNQNTRQNLMVCAIAAIMIGGIAWLIPAKKEPGVWWFRLGAMALLAWTSGFYYWAFRRKDLAPDFLHRFRQMFEKDGFTFVVGTEVIDGVCHLSVYFQNRYERPCQATVMVRTSERFLAPQRHLPDAALSVSADAGAYGKAVSPWMLPMELQGKKVLADVMAKRKYPHGRGKLLRYRSGLTVGSVPRSASSDVLRFFGFLGGINAGRSARTEILLPTNVASVVAIAPEEFTQTIWKLGDAVGENAKPDAAI
jgi:hypothetical protein